MKLLSKFFFAAQILLFINVQPACAQAVQAVHLATDGVLMLLGKNSEKKQEKIIETSTQQEKISSSNVPVLRVKDADIKSKAKAHIIALQTRLDQYHTLYQNNQPINLPKTDSDLVAIQDKDENWPTEDYASELKAYKRYNYQLSQKAAAIPAGNAASTPASPAQTDSTAKKP